MITTFFYITLSISTATFYLSSHYWLKLPLGVYIPVLILLSTFSVRVYAFSEKTLEDETIDLVSKEKAMRME